MGVTTTFTNKPINPRGNDASPLGYNRAALYSGKALDFDGVNDSVNLDGFTMSGNTGTFCFYADVDNDAYVFDINPNRFIFLHNTAQGIRVFNTNGWSDYGLIDREDTLFYTIVCDGTSQSVYVNGQQFGETKTVTALDLSAATQFKLGSNYLANGTFYNGTLSNYRIFNTALTAAQVSDLYNNPEKIVPTGVSNDALKLWLPMMEGAGTTAYDGSGNGNHGTINGATWTHGIGSPVSQTAVIDWNKGTNLATFSEDFSDSDWLTISATKVSTSETDPIGGSTAVNVAWTSGATAYLYQAPAAQNGNHTVSMYVKSNGGGNDFRLFGDGTNENSATLTATNEWQRFDFSFTGTGGTSWGIRATSGQDAADLLVAFAQLEATDSVGPYIPTLSTAQTSPVLLPQGLTSGRDITGVNLFENVRKQGALNLDGNSWAEVHDNASVDVGSFTLECWVNLEFTGTYQEFISKGDSAADRTFELYLNNTQNQFGVLINAAGYSFATQTINEGEWYHVVATYESTSKATKGYVNAVEKLSTTATHSPNYTDGDVVIGAWYDKSQLKTNGDIAQPRIYNRALTAEEVERNYNAGKNIYK